MDFIDRSRSSKKRPESILYLISIGALALSLATGCAQPAAPASTNADLASLTLSVGKLSPSFDAATTAYKVALPNSAESITVTGAAADSGATVGGDSGTAKTLAVGSTTITVTVTAADETTTKSYAVTVARAALYKITFDKNAADATGTMAAQGIDEGASAALAANAFAKTGYSFAGWAATSSGTVAYADKASYTMGSANVTLYAVWTVNKYKVYFDDGSGARISQDFTYGVSAALRANTYARSGCVFAGWATSSGGPVAYADKAAYSTGAADAVLYPVWTANGTIGVSLAAVGSDAVTFSGSLSVAKGTSLSVSADNAGLKGFQWYLDGSLIAGQTSASLSLATSGLVPGPHYLMVVATDSSSVQYSAGMTVRVTN